MVVRLLLERSAFGMRLLHGIRATFRDNTAEIDLDCKHYVVEGDRVGALKALFEPLWSVQSFVDDHCRDGSPSLAFATSAGSWKVVERYCSHPVSIDGISELLGRKKSQYMSARCVVSTERNLGDHFRNFKMRRSKSGQVESGFEVTP